ncbi:hypothetical protein B9Z55_009781 [Caenorhabditis nigoni]|uniref:Uncharacterized protein n=1 Tax=Caenorhabditis nigoni TaxID=1611254 RepID=A0A2G5UUE3_9PELO|nr:hypothetical protein B9Z55_009781 [Caenorhabditis nigoni]
MFSSRKKRRRIFFCFTFFGAFPILIIPKSFFSSSSEGQAVFEPRCSSAEKRNEDVESRGPLASIRTISEEKKGGGKGNNWYPMSKDSCREDVRQHFLLEEEEEEKWGGALLRTDETPE